MQLYFIDDSGTISPPTKLSQNHFVLGGLAVPEEQWHNLDRTFFQICKYFKVHGEIKWRFFGQKPGREDKENTLSHLSILDRDELRKNMLLSLTNHDSIKVIVAVVYMPTVYKQLTFSLPEEVYTLAYQSVIESFQYRLQDLSRETGSKIHGMIISDHRNPTQDFALRNSHNDILRSETTEGLRYPNLIENLFFAPSHHSVGIQFADLISGAIFRHFEHNDNRWYKLIESSIWKSATGQIEGHGLVKIPKKWKENDAESTESFNSIEPAIVTQSQRNHDHNSEANYSSSASHN